MNLNTLKTTLEQAKNFLATQDFIAVLQHFAFDEDTVTAYNDITACKLSLDTGLQCTIPGNLLLRLLNTLKSEEIEIEKAKSNSHVHVVSGRNKTKLPMLPLEEFVFKLPELTEKPIEVPASCMEGLRKCLTNVGSNPTRPEFNGVNLIMSSDSLCLYSSDGDTISQFKINDTFPIKALEEVQVILPSFFCERLSSLHGPLSGKDFNVPMQFSKQWAIAELGSNQIFARVIDRKPPKYEETLSSFCPDVETMELWDIPLELESIVSRHTIFLDPQAGITTTTFIVSGDEVDVKTTSQVGTCHDTLQIPVNLGNFSFAVDPNYLLRGFRICKKMTFQAHVIILQNDNFLHLIAPKAV
jgi:DNA polymerase III sliding clamp (beta) subunit (PCNA family)